MIGQQSQTQLHRNQRNKDNNYVCQYQTVNAYTHKPAFEQIFAIVIFIVLITLHSIFIVSAISVFSHSILWVILGVTYSLLIIMVYDYIYLTCTDPVDDLILKIDKKYKINELMECIDCKSTVHQRSHHCMVCNRCVQDFDHHCKYLNNCIGGKNYAQFLRLLVTVTAFCLTIIGQGVWIFVAAQNNASFQSNIISKWGVLATFIIAILALLAVDSLLCFHFYLIFFLKSTTYDYIKKQWQLEEKAQQQANRAIH